MDIPLARLTRLHYAKERSSTVRTSHNTASYHPTLKASLHSTKLSQYLDMVDYVSPAITSLHRKLAFLTLEKEKKRSVGWIFLHV
jgi:hypothetical protein